MGLRDRLRTTARSRGGERGRAAAEAVTSRMTPGGRRPAPEVSAEQLHVEAQRRRRETMEEARRALGELAVHQRRAELSARREADAVESLRDRARRAVAAGDQERAHDLLDELEHHSATARTWGARASDLARQVAESRRTVDRLERAAEAAAARQAALLADTQAAQARERLARAVPEIEVGAQELDRRLARAEAIAAGRAEVAWHDSESDMVRRAFQELEHSEDAAARLARLEEAPGSDRRLGGGSPG